MYLVLIEVVSTSNMVYKPIILNAKLTKIQFVIALIKEITVEASNASSEIPKRTINSTSEVISHLAERARPHSPLPPSDWKRHLSHDASTCGLD